MSDDKSEHSPPNPVKKTSELSSSESDDSDSQQASVATKMSASSSIKIEALTQHNYHSWKIQIEAILNVNGRWLDLDGKDDEKKDYASIAKKAYYDIILRCDGEHTKFLDSVAKHDSVKALQALIEKYEGKGAISELDILMNCFTMRHSSGPIDQHIDELRSKYRRLEEKGVKIPEIVRIANLMISVSNEYEYIWSQFITIDKDELHFDDIAGAILAEQRRRQFNEPRNVAASTKSLSRNERRKHLRCTSCNTKGHTADECRKSRLFCTTCNKPGHKTESCRKTTTNNRKTQAKQSSNVSTLHEDCDELEKSSFAGTIHKAFATTHVKQKPKKPVSRFQTNGKEESKLSSTLKANKQRLKSIIVRPFIEEANSTSSSPMDIEHEDKAEDIPDTPGKRCFIKNEDELSLSDISEFEIKCYEAEVIDILNKSTEIYETSFFSTHKNARNSGWVVDSGASIHMTFEENLFEHLTHSKCGKIRTANGAIIPIHGYGTVKILLKTSSEPLFIVLKNVAYVPDLHINLISVNMLNDAGHAVLFDKGSCELKVGQSFVRFARFIDNNFLVNEIKSNTAYPCVHEWHRRLAHRNLRDIKNLKDRGLVITKCTCLDQCDACMKGKTTCLPFTTSAKPNNALDIVVSDICGPLQTQSLGGSRYFLTITDVYSDYTEVKFLRHKSEAKTEIINFIEFTKTQLGSKPKVFRSDGGGEFVNDDLQNYLKSEGIKIQTTVPNTPQQNGIAERKNRTLNDAVRTLLIASKLPKHLWAEAMNNVVYTQNRIHRKNQKLSPIELFFGRKARATFIEFGRPVYVTTPRQGRGKLEPRAEVVKFLSVDDNAKGFRLWNGRKIVVERNIKPKLNISVDYMSPLLQTPVCNNHHEPHDEILDKNSNDGSGMDLNSLSSDKSTNSNANKERRQNDKSHDDFSNEKPSVELNSERPSNVPRRSERLLNRQHAANMSQRDIEPRTYKEAINSPDKDNWIDAMNEELTSLQETGTFELSDLPNDKKAIGCKWVFKRKSENNNVRFKARLVAKGFSQKYGEDYDEVFAPVARSPTIRLMLSMAGKLKLHVRQFDVKTAFLNGHLEEEIYMSQPEGFKVGSQVLRLRKSLYGLKQAARSWNIMLKSCLAKIEFTQSDADDCLFIQREGDKECYIVVHVDDMLCVATSADKIDKTFQQLSKYFTLKDLGQVKQFLGVDIHLINGFYGINQATYISKMAEELKVENSKPQKFPIDPGYFKLDCNEFLSTNSEYRKIIGMLLYVSTNSRPDISLSVGLLAQRVEKPRVTDLQEALRVVKYLTNTKDFILHLNNIDTHQQLIAFSDANHGECRIDGKSNSGIICFVNGGPIIWSSRKQTLVALSTCEAEYYAITETAKEVIWLNKLLESFNSARHTPTTILTDNQSTISMMEFDATL